MVKDVDAKTTAKRAHGKNRLPARAQKFNRPQRLSDVFGGDEVLPYGAGNLPVACMNNTFTNCPQLCLASWRWM